MHFEILGHNGGELINFYRTLFGWQLEELTLPGWPQYGIMEPPGGSAGIGGAIGAADGAPEGAVLVYVEVDDVHEYIDRASKMGATVALPATKVAGTNLTVAWLQDPQGNLCGLVKREGH